MMGKIILSALVGGGIGLANLWLWWRIVSGLADRQGAPVAGLAGRFVLKLLLLAGLLWIVFHSPLAPWGVAAGFGSVLIMLACKVVFGSRENA